MAENIYFEHKGPYDAHSRSNDALRFLANYTAKIDSANYDGSYLPYYHPDAVFHDATGIDYVGGQAIWTWITKLFEPFNSIYMEIRLCLVVSRPDGTHTIHCEWFAHFWLKHVKDENGESKKITIPRGMVFELGPAKDDGSERKAGEDVGFEGLQILSARLYYDRSLLVPYLRRSEQEVEKFGA
ncbi:uncharacterized protein PAC_01619 [Phialocephala subalpina]|uniref:SnoaL-like domain-containing protein n=1 Tax=Phialocephala subalpina TaxID=576137 RepID=A0A1L7WG44_9HELO|nr:uncharacterized protein PAC_01619 [Phialocephala subalpina]